MTSTATSSSEVARTIAGGKITSVYQPIVELEAGVPVAYEALSRGPEGSPLERPDALFGAARQEGLVVALDRACRERALRGALDAGLADGRALFVNVEPSSLGQGPLIENERSLAAAGLPVFIEFTERELAARPAELLAAVEWLRERGFGIALDDVGADDRSLALLPFLAPDVIKLDLRLVQERQTSTETARVVNAVAAETERSGAAFLAEGIETDEQLRRARGMGANLGQGWFFGRPGPLPRSDVRGADGIPVGARPAIDSQTPLQLIARERPMRRGDKRLLIALARQLEIEARSHGAEAIILSTFQDESFFTGASRERYIDLAQHVALAGVLGVGISSQPAPGVRGGAITPGEALADEWDVVVLTPHFAGAFAALDLGDDVADLDRRFDFAITYDRELVVRAARSLMVRVSAIDRPVLHTSDS